MASPYPDLAERLAHDLSFSLADLESNRAGRLAPRQQIGLLLVYGAVLALTLLFPLSYLIGLFVAPLAPDRELWIVFFCLGVPVLLLGAWSLWSARAVVVDALTGKVSQRLGPARVEALTRTVRGRSDTRHRLHIGDRAFDLPAALADALPPGRVYRAYFLPQSGKLVSLEPVG
jgi:hypothetical protein